MEPEVSSALLKLEPRGKGVAVRDKWSLFTCWLVRVSEATSHTSLPETVSRVAGRVSDVPQSYVSEEGKHL